MDIPLQGRNVPASSTEEKGGVFAEYLGTRSLYREVDLVVRGMSTVQGDLLLLSKVSRKL